MRGRFKVYINPAIAQNYLLRAMRSMVDETLKAMDGLGAFAASHVEATLPGQHTSLRAHPRHNEAQDFESLPKHVTHAGSIWFGAGFAKEAWNAIVFYVTASASMFLVLNFELWPFAKWPAVIRQPLLGIVWSITVLLIAIVAFNTGVHVAGMDAVSFWSPFRFHSYLELLSS